MVDVACIFRYIKLKKYLQCMVKTGTFFLWVILYILIMRLTIFKNAKVEENDEEDPYPSNETELWENKWAENFEENVNSIKNYEDYTNEELLTIESEFEARRRRVWTTCLKHNLHLSEHLNHKEFFIVPQHGLVWCNIFKAASSSWMYKFNVLGGYTEDFLRRTRETPLTLARKKFPRPSLNYLEASLPGSISFITVREPFERLLSAYRNKIERYRNKFYRKTARDMIKRYRNETESMFGKIKNYGPTFYEFIKYITENHKLNGDETKYDEHWSPYYQFCTPCKINFTVITKVETFKRDSDYIIYHAGLESILLKPIKEKKLRVKTIMNKSKDGKNTKNLMRKYFGQLNKENLDDLLLIYGIDFEMFGYDPSVYYEYVRKKVKKDAKNTYEDAKSIFL